ncbi:MAG: cache domain-containing protein, partial [Deltaproteobacteria bacterium]|nr:cache domain-containing protein [Deltaproteobacteria bacterium]
MRLARKFAVIFAMLSIISISVMGYLAYTGGRKMIIKDKYSDLTLANDYTVAAIERWLKENIQILEMIAQNPFFQKEFQGLLAAHDPFDTEHMKNHQRFIEERLRPVVEAGSFTELFILRPVDGLVSFSTNKKQEEKQLDHQPFFVFGKNRTHVQSVYYSMFLQQAAMTIGTPIRNREGELVAVLAGHLNLRELSKIMEQGRTFNRTLDTYLVNKFNFFVTEPRFGNNFALKKSVHTEGVRTSLSGKEGIALYGDYRDVPVIGAYRWIPRWELAIISEIDQAEAFAPIVRLRKTIMTV